MLKEGDFIRHEPCEECGSSDAKAVYSNGTAYCFSCETYFPSEDGDDTGRERVRMSDGLIHNINYIDLTTRKINKETTRKFGYGVANFRGEPVHVAPYRWNGEIVAQHIRTKDKKFPWLGKTGHLELFGQHLWETNGKRLVIAEGEIDAMSIAQMFNLKWAVVSVPNGAQSASKYIKQNLEWVEGFKEVVFAFDNDSQGQAAAKECAQLLTPSKAKIANFEPYKDANEMLQAGKGGDIPSRIFSAKEYRPDGIVVGEELSYEELRKDENIMSYSVPFPIFDARMKGIRKGEITTVGAGTGIGKSTFVRELAYHLFDKHQLKVGYVALEEGIKKSAHGFMGIRLDVPMGKLHLNKDIVPEEQYREAYDHVVGSNRIAFYDHFGSLDSGNLMAKLKYLATGLEVDFIILDHISIVISGIEGGDERRMIDHLMTSLRSLVENTGVGMLLVSHLRVPQGQQQAHEEGGRVTLNQFRGSGSIKQISDNLVGLERNQQGKNPDRTLVRILKNRLFGDTGICDAVKYDKETGRMKALEQDPKDELEEETEDEISNPFT